jgi:tight adherence protein C
VIGLPVVLLGLALGCGLILTVSSLPPLRRMSLADRIEPYVSTGATASRLLAAVPVGLTPWPTLERLVAPGLGRAADRLEPVLGSSAALAKRLDQLGGGTTVQEFRVEQLAWSVAGLGAGLVLLVLVTARSSFPSPLLAAVLLATGAVTGALARDRHLGTEIARRTDQIRSELPTVAELLALSVAAGEGTTAAVERVSRVGNGALVQELRRVLSDTRSGSSLASGLESLAERIDVPELRRLVAAVVVAAERGTPLAPVLQAQAVDARESGRRALIEAGGRKEIAMMVPVVFLVLPVSVVFALFPGFYGLTLSSP